MPFPELKRFVVKRIAAEALRPPEGFSLTTVVQLQVAAQLELAFTTIAPNHPNLLNNGSLQDLLQEQLARAEAQHVDNSSEHQQARTAYLAALTDHVKSSWCTGCGRKGTHVCNGTADDKLKLDSAGRCIKEINQQFDYLKQKVQTAIVQLAFANDTAAFADLNVHLSRAFSTGPVPGVKPQHKKHFAEGWTRYKDTAQVRVSEVILQIESRFFDWSSLLCVTWLIAHELVCHAFQGSAGKVRQACHAHCAFYEGWMDEVAYQLLAFLLSTLNAPRSRKKPLPTKLLARYRGDILDQARAFRAERYGRLGSPEAQWDFGKRTAQLLLQFFERSCRSADGLKVHEFGLKQLIRLSFWIQRCDPTNDDVGQSVTHVFRLLKRLELFEDRAYRGAGDCRIELGELLARPFADFPAWVQELATLEQQWAGK